MLTHRQIYLKGITDRLMRKAGLHYRRGHFAFAKTTLYVTPGVGFSGVTRRHGEGTEAEVAVVGDRLARYTTPRRRGAARGWNRASLQTVRRHAMDHITWASEWPKHGTTDANGNPVPLPAHPTSRRG